MEAEVYVRNICTGGYLNVHDGKTVQQYFTDDDNSKWILHTHGNINDTRNSCVLTRSWVTLRNKACNKYLNVEGGKESGKVSLWDDPDDASCWYVGTDVAEKVFGPTFLRNKCSRQYLNVEGGKKDNRAVVGQWGLPDGASQWIICGNREPYEAPGFTGGRQKDLPWPGYEWQNRTPEAEPRRGGNDEWKRFAQ